MKIKKLKISSLHFSEGLKEKWKSKKEKNLQGCMGEKWGLMDGEPEKSTKSQDTEEEKGCLEQEKEQIIKKH